MSPSRLEVSNHASDRIKLRKITRQQLRKCLHQGQLIALDLNGRSVNILKFENKELIVIYLKIPNGFLIITSYWKGL